MLRLWLGKSRLQGYDLPSADCVRDTIVQHDAHVDWHSVQQAPPESDVDLPPGKEMRDLKIEEFVRSAVLKGSMEVPIIYKIVRLVSVSLWLSPTDQFSSLHHVVPPKRSLSALQHHLAQPRIQNLRLSRRQ